MDEHWWLTCHDPSMLIAFLNDRDASARKFRLFSCACCRQVWGLMPDERAREVVRQAERFADGLLAESERRVVQDTFRSTFPPRMTPDDPVPASYVAGMVAFYAIWTNSVSFRGPHIHRNQHGAECVSAWVRRALVLDVGGPWDHPPDHPIEAAEARRHCRWLRDAFGNPFRPVQFRRRWRSRTAVALASLMYEDCDFAAMPVLADALQEAGCERPDVLGHCREAAEHVRGCWVVDLVLGKA